MCQERLYDRSRHMSSNYDNYSILTVSAAQALRDAGIEPLRLRPKEALAIMNGTAVMTGLAVLAYGSADYLGQLVTRITAMASVGFCRVVQPRRFFFVLRLPRLTLDGLVLPTQKIGRRTTLRRRRRLRTDLCGSCGSVRCRRARSRPTGTI